MRLLHSFGYYLGSHYSSHAQQVVMPQNTASVPVASLSDGFYSPERKDTFVQTI